MLIKPDTTPQEVTAGVIEVGTNSTKLLVARREDGGGLSTLCYQRRITRLGKGLEDSGSLDPESMWRTAATVQAYHRLALDRGAEKVAVVGTHVLRAADNSLDFLVKVKELTGLEVEILTGDQEARATRDGALYDSPETGGRNLVVLDIGGGSTEIVRGVWSRSIPMGAVSLTESCFFQDPPRDTQLVRASTRFRDRLLREVTFLVPGDRINIIGVGGTVTATAALWLKLDRYRPRLIEGFSLDGKKLDIIMDRLVKTDLPGRRSMMSFDPDRSDVIIAGLLILKVFFKYFHVDSFTVSMKNLIHGIFLKKFGKASKVN